MNFVHAFTICENLGSSMFSEREKARAVHAVLYSATPVTASNSDLLIKISKWLFEAKYGHLLNL